jgi:hypothetical protein
VIFAKPLHWVIQNRNRFLICCLLLLLTTLFPYEMVQLPELGLLVGTTHALTFPVLQYFVIFLIGMYFAYYEIIVTPLLITLALTGVVSSIILAAVANLPLERFPPSFGWILRTIPFVILWYTVARYLAAFRRFREFFIPIGANSLFYLLISNLVLFALKASFPIPIASLTGCVLITLGVTAGIRYCASLVRHVQLNQIPSEG